MFSQFGDLERCLLRPGNVHGAEAWRPIFEPVVVRHRDRWLRRSFRANAAFAKPEIYESLEAKGWRWYPGNLGYIILMSLPPLAAWP